MFKLGGRLVKWLIASIVSIVILVVTLTACASVFLQGPAILGEAEFTVLGQSIKGTGITALLGLVIVAFLVLMKVAGSDKEP